MCLINEIDAYCEWADLEIIILHRDQDNLDNLIVRLKLNNNMGV